MSVRVMSAIWDLRDLSPVDKLALLALADWANDDGDAWPSIRQIADKTGCGERTVQRAFRNAEAMGILTRVEVKGKGCKYNIHPRHTGTGDTQAPPPHRRDTPATQAPNTSEHINVDKAKALPTKRVRTLAKKPDCVSDSVWRDWLAHRKTAFTDTALEGFEREAAKAGWSLEAAIRESIERSWQGFKADWVKNNGTANRTSSTDRRSSLARAIDEGLGYLG